MPEVLEFGKDPEALAYVTGRARKTVYLGTHPDVRKMTPKQLEETLAHENLHQAFMKVPEVAKETPATMPMLTQLLVEKRKHATPKQAQQLEDIVGYAQAINKIQPYKNLTQKQKGYLSEKFAKAMQPTQRQMGEAFSEMEHRGIERAEREMRSLRNGQ